MSIYPQATSPVPQDVQRVARIAFPHGNISIQVADHPGNIDCDTPYTALCPPCGQPAAAPTRLALATIFQFAEDLSDHQAAEAVRLRVSYSRAAWPDCACLRKGDAR